MWARVQFQLRARAARIVSAIGTPEGSMALLALAAAHAAAVEIWSRVGSAEGAEAFATSWGAWLLAAAIVVDAMVHALRRLPALAPAWFSGDAPAPQRSRRRAAAALLLTAAWLLVGLAFLVSLTFRDRFTLWLGEGEILDGRPGQYLTRSTPRPMSPGPKPLELRVRAVAPQLDERGDLLALDVRVELGGARKTTSPRWPVWVGGGRFLRATGYGYAPRFEVRDGSGRLLDGALIKLDLLPPGRTDEIRTEVMPHRFYLRLTPIPPAEGGSAGGRAFGFEVDVFREKQPVASGRVRLGEPLPFEGFTFAITEVNYLARFVLVDDPGILILIPAGIIALVGAALELTGRSRGGA